MKKLSRKMKSLEETIEAYACACKSCSCYCVCGCPQPEGQLGYEYGKFTQDQSDYSGDAYNNNYYS